MRPHATGFLLWQEGHCQDVSEEGNAGVSRWKVWLTPNHAAGISISYQFATGIFSRKFLWQLCSRENYCCILFLEKIPVAIFFSRKFLLQYFSRENSCGNYFLEKIPVALIFSRKFMCKMHLVGRWLSGWFYAFNLQKSEILGTVDRNVPRNSLENSRELVRNREEKLTGIFSRNVFLEKIRVKTGEKLFSREIL